MKEIRQMLKAVYRIMPFMNEFQLAYYQRLADEYLELEKKIEAYRHATSRKVQ